MIAGSSFFLAAVPLRARELRTDRVRALRARGGRERHSRPACGPVGSTLVDAHSGGSLHERFGQKGSVFGCEPRFRSPRCPPRRRTGRPPLTLGRLMPVRAGSPNVRGGAGSKPGSWLHLGSERRTPCRRAPRLKARRGTQRHPGCAPLASLGVNASRWRG